jgi:hypothetical protein
VQPGRERVGGDDGGRRGAGGGATGEGLHVQKMSPAEVRRQAEVMDTKLHHSIVDIAFRNMPMHCPGGRLLFTLMKTNFRYSGT